MKTNFFLKIAGILLLVISFIACKNTGKDGESVTGLEVQKISYKIGDQVPNDLVCMVNNAFMGKAQMEVPVDGKMYYGCCEMCVGRLNDDESSRMATDPHSGNPVDKSEAYIVLENENGKVSYFESRENFESYKGK
ncbi:hypothetical protein BH23BAC2_BH23BAC2_23480 [soil metagenome]